MVWDILPTAGAIIALYGIGMPSGKYIYEFLYPYAIRLKYALIARGVTRLWLPKSIIPFNPFGFIFPKARIFPMFKKGFGIELCRDSKLQQEIKEWSKYPGSPKFPYPGQAVLVRNSQPLQRSLLLVSRK
jgi:hypothetical protein